MDSDDSETRQVPSTDVAVTMTAILGSMLAVIAGLLTVQIKQQQQPSDDSDNDNNDKNGSTTIPAGGTWLPNPRTEPSKRAYEIYALMYTPVWISAFACIVAFGLYEDFDEWSYMKVCLGLSLPFLLQPVLLPFSGGILGSSPDTHRPLSERYCFKANLWLAIYSFIGNYWYTHYFYSVLHAKYTMPAHRLNNVPLALYFATHFYFSTYHVFSNLLLRKIVTTYQRGIARTILYIATVLTFAYFTAFMETLTISAYPDYSFDDRNMAYTVGSAFYGIYFIVSFPAFFVFDQHIDQQQQQDDSSNNSHKNHYRDQRKVVTVWDTIVSSCGYGMMIMILLDLVRLYMGIPLVIGSSDMVCSMNAELFR
jgi:cycloeucalenol cycloisomerase